jgi:hypothetical protein
VNGASDCDIYFFLRLSETFPAAREKPAEKRTKDHTPGKAKSKKSF